MIHKFRMFGTNIVIDVNSGAVHIVDDVAYDVLDYYKGSDDIIRKLEGKYNAGQIAEAIDELRQLESEGLLFSNDVFENFQPVYPSQPVIKALCLHIAHDCNLRCRYCFASSGHFGGERKLMDFETAKAAIDFLICNSGNRRNLEVDFFGGEPLMNFEVVRRIVDYARSIEKKHDKNFRFTITTNAVLLNDENIKYINENMSNVVLSIDGRKHVNDIMRKRIDGRGTYDDILPKIKRMIESRENKSYYVRGTFTKENLDFSEDVLHLAGLGFKNISVEPVVVSDASEYALKKEDIPQICREYEKLANEYVKMHKKNQGFNFFHFMIDLENGPCLIKKMSGCGSGCEYVAVTPEGDIYPCHQFTGIEKFRLGNVLKGDLNTESISIFRESNILSKSKCRECWAKFFCSGGCIANAYQLNNDINKPYEIGCELEKKRVECALWVKHELLSNVL